jgi:hypothetical protein
VTRPRTTRSRSARPTSRVNLGLTMRMSVHDEVFGDVVDEEAARRSRTVPQRVDRTTLQRAGPLGGRVGRQLGGKEGRVKSTLGRVSETDLQSKFIQLGKIALPEFIIIPHRNPSEAGTPDFSITGNGKTSWWELKLARPTVRSAWGSGYYVGETAHVRGVARYLIFRETNGKRRRTSLHQTECRTARGESSVCQAGLSTSSLTT